VADAARNLLFVTGGSSGLGLALARAVPFPARCVEFSRRGGPVGEHVRADLSMPEAWTLAAQTFDRELRGGSNEPRGGSNEPRGGSFEPAGRSFERALLIHAAGTLEPIGCAGEVDAAEYRRAVLLNSAAGQVLGDAFLRALRGARVARACVAMISSGAAFKVYPGWSSYGAGKAALDHWVRTVAAEQPPGAGVRLLSIAPGVLDTEMQAQVRAADAARFAWVQEFRELHARGGLRSPDEAAREIWELLEGDAPSGSVLDLRRL
jgi:NAD(P)-dependent dehydrogenase (short-subunit alcohol dehydrogenase family)